MEDEQLRGIIRSEIKSILKEDYARGIPDFALSDVAKATIDGLKVHLNNHILQTCTDPVQQRKKFDAANEVLKSIEPEIKQYLENKLADFMRRV